MTRYDSLDEFKKNASDSEKLHFLRHEMPNLISRIHGYAAVAKQKLTQEGDEANIENIQKYLSEIIEASKDLGKLREMLTNIPNEE